MVDALHFHEISESTHWMMNPMSLDKAELLGGICRVGPKDVVLDLACGKGAFLTRLAERFGASGVGVDIHPPFLEVARRRATEHGVAGRLRFVEGDAGDPACADGRYGVVSCLGATWIGGGLTGTLRHMQRWLLDGGWLLVGEPYWSRDASAASRSRHVGGDEGEGFADLAGTLKRFEALDLDLVEMLLSSPEEWDRYSASQWLNVSDWLAGHPDDPDAAEVRRIRDESRRGYLAEDRDCLGWGVFVLRAQ